MKNEKEIVKKFTEELTKNQKSIPGEIRQVVDENFWDLMNDDCTLMSSPEPTSSIVDKSPRYTKTEIENRLYRLIDDENIFSPEEDIHMGPVYKLLNKFLDSLE